MISKELFFIIVIKFISIQLLISQDNVREIDLLEKQLGRDYKQARIEQLCELSELYIKSENYEKADEILKIAIDKTKNSADKMDHAMVLKAKGKLFFELKKYDQAIQNFTESLLTFQHKHDWGNLEEALKLICYCYEQKGDYKQALHWAKKAQEISNKEVGLIHNNSCSIGYMYQQLENYDSAEYYFKKCKQYRLKYKKYPLALDAYGNLQYLYRITKQYNNEFQEILEKEKLCIEMKDSFNLADVIRTKASFFTFLE
jgi:tetratricopeptide (TPR) repeat protein